MHAAIAQQQEESSSPSQSVLFQHVDKAIEMRNGRLSSIFQEAKRTKEGGEGTIKLFKWGGPAAAVCAC